MYTSVAQQVAVYVFMNCPEKIQDMSGKNQKQNREIPERTRENPGGKLSGNLLFCEREAEYIR